MSRFTKAIIIGGAIGLTGSAIGYTLAGTTGQIVSLFFVIPISFLTGLVLSQSRSGY